MIPNSNQLLKKWELLRRKLPYRVSILLEKEVNASNSKWQLLEFLKHPKISRWALSFLGAKVCLMLKRVLYKLLGRPWHTACPPSVPLRPLYGIFSLEPQNLLMET